MKAGQSQKRRPYRGADHSKTKLALLCAPGGHFEQMQNLSNFYNDYSHFWITAKNTQTDSSLTGEKKYFIKVAHFKEPWTYLYQIPQCLRIFIKEKPTHFISTGSGRIVFLPFLLSIIFRVKFIHIETFSYVNRLTKVGRLLSKMQYPILSQWRSSKKDNVVYIGPIMRNETSSEAQQKRNDHVFVTLGTRAESFPRLLRAVETLKREGAIKEKVIVQAGHTKYRSALMEIFDYRPPNVIDDLIRNASYVITQESAGIGTKCLKFNTPMIVMPRNYSQGELPAKSDMNEDLHYRLQELGFTFVVDNVEDLRAAIGNLAKLKVGYVFDNSLAVAKLNELVGNS